VKKSHPYARRHEQMPPLVENFDQWLAWNLRQRALSHAIRKMREQKYAHYQHAPEQKGFVAFVKAIWKRLKTKFASAYRTGVEHRA